MENQCFICEQSSDVVVYRQNGFESRLCPDCGLLYCNPLPQDNEVDFERDFHDDSFYKMPAKYKAKWLAKKIGYGKDFLEVGSGKGHLLNELANGGFQVAGLEPNPIRINYMRDTYSIEAHQGLLEDYEFYERKFGVVFHVDLLAHFPDPFLALEKMKSLVEKDGYISFEVGIIGGISNFWYRFFTFGLPQHRWLYSEKSMEKFLKKANLIILHRTSHSLIPYFILKRISSIILISILSRFLKPVIGKKAAVLIRLNQSFSTFLRYNVGRYFPNYGPLTILYITKPVS